MKFIIGPRPQSDSNKMADEENFDSEAEDSEEDKSPGDSDSSEEEEEEDGTHPPIKDMESFINDESDEGEGVVEGERKEAIAEGEEVSKGEGEEEEVGSEDGMGPKRSKRGREL